MEATMAQLLLSPFADDLMFVAEKDEDVECDLHMNTWWCDGIMEDVDQLKGDEGDAS